MESATSGEPVEEEKKEEGAEDPHEIEDQ